MKLRTRVVSALLRMYPALWRREYGAELADLLLSEPLGARTISNVVWNALVQRARMTRFAQLVRNALLVSALLITILFLSTGWAIKSGVQAVSATALDYQTGDPVLALMRYADSPQHSLRERNRAVWALGQLGDTRALPVLEKYYTGGACNHARTLCQHELRKAIGLCRGAMNITASVWR